jgi:hypothetical protein
MVREDGRQKATAPTVEPERASHRLRACDWVSAFRVPRFGELLSSFPCSSFRRPRLKPVVLPGCRSLGILHVAAALVLGAADFCMLDTRQGKPAQLAGLRVQP